MRKRQLYKRLRDAVEARGDDSAAVEGLQTRALRSMIGPEAAGATVTLLDNARRRLGAELRRREMQATADWIISRVQTRFAGAEVKIRRGRVIEVWLDGVPNNETVFFVGGRGDKSGREATAGGCTKQWWDGQCPNGTDAEKAAAMAKLMGTDGEPIIDVANASYTQADNRITRTNIAAGVGVGMIVYVVESGTPDQYLDTGRYLITDRDTDDDWIECGEGIDCEYDVDVDVVIGGAFDTLQNALDETDAALHSVAIHTNLSETLSGSVNVDAGGDVLRNTFKRVIGFNTVPGDMARGGTYYESALEILANDSIDASKCVSLDANDGSYSVLDISGVDNLVFENLHLTNTSTTGDAVYFASVSNNIVLRNCRFSDVLQVMGSEANGLLFDRCYSHDDIVSHQYVFRGYNNVLLGCVGKMGANNFVNFVSRPGAVIGCVAVGGQFGVRMALAGAAGLVIGNTFYNTQSKGVILDGADGAVVVNNIFCLAPGAVGLYSRSGGSFVQNDYNCFIESDGTPLAPTGTEHSGGETPVMGVHSLLVDPDFADEANGDFRVRNPLLLRGGRPGPDGRAAVIGAIGQEYQFAARARMVNPGRAGIVR